MEGAIELWKRKASGSGKASIDDLGGILARLPAGQQVAPELYAEIRQCIRDEIRDFMKSSQIDCDNRNSSCKTELSVLYNRCMAKERRGCIEDCMYHWNYDRDTCVGDMCNFATMPAQSKSFYDINYKLSVVRWFGTFFSFRNGGSGSIDCGLR